MAYQDLSDILIFRLLRRHLHNFLFPAFWGHSLGVLFFSPTASVLLRFIVLCSVAANLYLFKFCVWQHVYFITPRQVLQQDESSWEGAVECRFGGGRGRAGVSFMFDGSLIEYTAYRGRKGGTEGEGGCCGACTCVCVCVRVLAAKHFPHFPGDRRGTAAAR